MCTLTAVWTATGETWAGVGVCGGAIGAAAAFRAFAVATEMACLGFGFGAAGENVPACRVALVRAA